VWQSLLGGLGSILAFLYDIVPSYGVAIVLLTLLVRFVLLPLTIKQTRSMQAMGQLQPKLKEIQRKHKGNKQKISEETMKLYKEHRVNPLGGCLPLLLQLPIFFALFSVLRTATAVSALPVEPVTLESVKGESVFCAPTGRATARGNGSDTIECEIDGETRTFDVAEWRGPDGETIESPGFVSRCAPVESGDSGEANFRCESPVGTDHLPRESDLFADIVEDRATFLGMHLSCGATQAQSGDAIRQCAPPGTTAGGGPLVGYYGLIALMVASTWYQTKQMQATQQAQAQQMQMMGRIMPVFLGFISLSIPAGVLVYWVTTNGWQVGQQYVMLRARQSAEQRAEAPRAPKPKAAQAEGSVQPKAERPPQRKGGSARSRKKRRKR